MPLHTDSGSVPAVLGGPLHTNSGSIPAVLGILLRMFDHYTPAPQHRQATQGVFCSVGSRRPTNIRGKSGEIRSGSPPLGRPVDVEPRGFNRFYPIICSNMTGSTSHTGSHLFRRSLMAVRFKRKWPVTSRMISIQETDPTRIGFGEPERHVLGTIVGIEPSVCREPGRESMRTSDTVAQCLRAQDARPCSPGNSLGGTRNTAVSATLRIGI